MDKLVILGGGESGVGAALLGKQKGWEVFLSDRGQLKEKFRNVLLNNDVLFEEGQHSEEVLQADLVVKSPGIPETAELVETLRNRGVDVVSEIEFAGRYSKARFIGITGSNGKTTTALLTYHILKRGGINVGLAGNVGSSLAKMVAEGDVHDWVVLELSSFQLDGMFAFKCDIAVLLNITEDHLDRYDHQLMNYARSKVRIAQNQTANDWFIYNADDAVIKSVMAEVKCQGRSMPFSIQNQEGSLAAFATDNQLIINPTNNQLIMTIQELALQGKHNIYNSMASGIAARILEIRKDLIRECLSDFQNIEHRLEMVNEVYGISFINDSKATNVNSTWYALECMSQPIVWIVGGVDKGNDYTQLKDMVKNKVRGIVCLGKDNKKLIESFGDVIENISEADNMRDAVYAAYKMGQKGDAVLLSPACASFDLFEDYEDRGRQFKEAVRNL